MAFISSSLYTFTSKTSKNSKHSTSFLNTFVQTHSFSIHQRTTLHSSIKSHSISMVDKVSGQQLEDTLKNLGSTPLVVDFYATWCGPCQFLGPELEKLEKKYDGKVRVVKVDTEAEEDLSSALRIRGLPTLMFIQDGQLKYRMEGALPVDSLVEICEQAFFGKVVENESEAREVREAS
eukprot:CAMPEP_0182445658 /NCGR_PEP_ID=MMETSP1172-20130603/3711_1 /TAXON_ID=708627 /ORGANISM="Timspurckia oligopyrenoides, Strain CCMP3278" /LENGTH=177 /DNA_ID=CAMNT_0024641469 /DNA_START=57 /DNA_END=590 /DNA_ORIENTATION=+